MVNTEQKDRVEDAGDQNTELLIEANEHIHLGRWEADIEYNTVWWSDEIYQMLGLEPQSLDLTSEIFIEILRPDERERVAKIVQDSIENHKVLSYGYWIVRPCGEERYFRSNGKYIFDDDGNAIRIVGTTQDVTEQQQAEAKLRKSEFLLSEAQELAHLGNWEYEAGKETLYWSDETFRLLGVEPGSFEPTIDKFISLLHPEDQEFGRRQVEIAISKGVPLSYEHRVILPDGSERILLERGRILTDANGQVERLFGTALDVTEARQAQQALQESHDELERRVKHRTHELGATLETMVEGVVRIDDSGVIESFNRSAEKMFGYAGGEVIGKNVRCLMGSEDGARHDGYIHNFLTTGESKIIGVGREVTGRHKNGSKFPVWLGIGVMEIDGRRKFVGTLQDIAAQREAQTALEKSERSLRNITDLSPVGIYQGDPNGLLIFVNDRWREIMGLEGDEALNEGWINSMHPDDRERVIKDWQNFIESGGEVYRLECRIVRPDGSTAWLISQAIPDYSSSGELLGYVGTLTDITDLKKTQSALGDSERRLALAMKGANDGLWDWDVANNSMYFSPRWLEMFGYEDSDGPEGQAEWEQLVHPDDRAQRREFLADCIAKRTDKYDLEFRLRHRDGHYVDVMSRGSSVYDDSGQILRMVGTHADISERKRAEAQILEAKQMAETANRAKSDFLSNMSHELRTPMNAVLGFAQLLEQDEDGLLDTHKDFVAEILRSGHHMMDLINEVLDLAKVESGKISLDCHSEAPRPLIENCLHMIETTAQNDAIVVENLLPEDDLPVIDVDATRFKQILLNLLSNAVKYNRPNGKISLGCNTETPKTFRIWVTDTGQGIPKEKHAQVFEAFDRLGREDSGIAGTGIGLTVTKQLVESMGGAIGFESTVGTGTTFWIDVPLTKT